MICPPFGLHDYVSCRSTKKWFHAVRGRDQSDPEVLGAGSIDNQSFTASCFCELVLEGTKFGWFVHHKNTKQLTS